MPPKKNTIDDSEDDDPEVSEEDDNDDEDIKINGYVPPETLSDVHWHRRSVSDLMTMLESPYLNLNPDYQRDVVWTSERMTRLINSMQSNYYIPPLIFNVTEIDVVKSDGNGYETRYMRVSIDGKQRLSSIRDFVHGEVPCTDKKNRRWYFCDNGKKGPNKKRILPEKLRKKFLAMDLLCAEYSNLERKQEEDLFSRVQLGVPLTPAEKLRASSGAWQSYAIELEGLFAELMEIVDHKRGRGFQLVLQVLRQIVNGNEDIPTYSAGASSLKGFCEKPQLLDDAVRLAANRVFSTYNDIKNEYPNTFKDQGYKHAKKYSPIEFVGAAVLIHRFPDRNSKVLSQDILHLRRWLRDRRQDLRSNTQTWKEIMEFINNLEVYRGGSGVRSATRDNATRRLAEGNASAEDATNLKEDADGVEDGEISEHDGSDRGRRPDISTQDALGNTANNTAKRPEPSSMTAHGKAGLPLPFDPKGSSILMGGPQLKQESVVNGHKKFQRPNGPPSADPISATPAETPLFIPSARSPSFTPAPHPLPHSLPIRPPSNVVASRFKAVPSSPNRDRNLRKRKNDEPDGPKSPPLKKEKTYGPFSFE